MPAPPSYVDLHAHSRCSDGTLSPAEVVRLAVKNGLTAICLTDHDTAEGCDEAAAEAARLGIDFLPGIEISCAYPRPGTMHLLGYGIDPAGDALRSFTRRLQTARHERNLRIIHALREHGVSMTLAEVEAISGQGVVGRPHFAMLLIRKGYVSHPAEAFRKYLGQGGLAFVDKEQFTPKQAIGLIHAAGGLVSLAHPKQLQKPNDAQLTQAIKDLADDGLDAVEVIHSDHRESYVDFLGTLADRFGLLKTGGSDYHGSNKPHITLGRANLRRIPREWYDRLVERLPAVRRAGYRQTLAATASDGPTV